MHETLARQCSYDRPGAVIRAATVRERYHAACSHARRGSHYPRRDRPGAVAEPPVRANHHSPLRAHDSGCSISVAPVSPQQFIL
ncbi:MAG: hypothetical protein ACP5R2_09385 [Anaerolineae bacterium]